MSIFISENHGHDRHTKPANEPISLGLALATTANWKRSFPGITTPC